jgi:hypothetical protein
MNGKFLEELRTRNHQLVTYKLRTLISAKIVVCCRGRGVFECNIAPSRVNLLLSTSPSLLRLTIFLWDAFMFSRVMQTIFFHYITMSSAVFFMCLQPAKHHIFNSCLLFTTENFPQSTT